MREIKFRGYRKDIGWKYGYLTSITNSYKENMPAIKPFDEEYITYGVESESVGEFTGLKDKNGKEIYEGDILKWNYRGKTKVGEVVYSHYLFNVRGFYVPTQDNPEGAFSENHPIEVIGNIYESPELLEQA